MPRPSRPPIGLHLARAARSVSRAFDDALAQAGGSVPVWLVLISLKSQQLNNQRELAEAVGIREATLTHHLNAMDEQGLITRRRDPANRRVHLVELTEPRVLPGAGKVMPAVDWPAPLPRPSRAAAAASYGSSARLPAVPAADEASRSWIVVTAMRRSLA